MIGYFPEPYPEELFHSVCTRFAERAGLPSMKIAKRELLFLKSGSVNFDLPHNIPLHGNL